MDKSPVKALHDKKKIMLIFHKNQLSKKSYELSHVSTAYL